MARLTLESTILNDADAAQLKHIRRRTMDVLRVAIGDARDVAVVDAPNQRNIGDSLIWEGELQYLREMGCRIRYVSDIRCFDARALAKRLPDDGVVLLHGGGNFGDIWTGHQGHREAVVATLHQYRVVQLPQSIFFADSDNAARANRILGAHPDFVVLLRDSLSIERAHQQLPDVTVRFCPDMALGWEPPPRSDDHAQPSEIVAIARADREASSGLRGVSQNWIPGHRVNVTDWGLHARDPLRWRLARAGLRLQHILVAGRRKTGIPVPALPQRFVLSLLKTTNIMNVRSALRLYARAKALVVDRLHAHVLALLLGLDHVLLDNNYRKLAGVFKDYTGVFTTARYCTDLIDAEQELRAIVGA